jgi:large subunit ribosomal protein L5
MASKEVRLKAKYRDDVAPALTKKFGYTNVMAVPRLEKIVVNVGVGDALQNIKLLDVAADELGAITGQKPIINRARRSIASFKLREGNAIGTSVTLRSAHMYEFLDRLMSIALPRVRDFRGVPTKSFDGRGNYTLGLKDQLVFLEINYSKVEQVRGMNITIVTTARTDEESRELLRLLGMPFRKAAA